MFCFYSTSDGRLALSSIFALHKVFVFVNATRTERNLRQWRKCFFRFPVRLQGKTDEETEFMIAEGIVEVCLLHFSKFQAEISILENA